MNKPIDSKSRWKPVDDGRAAPLRLAALQRVGDTRNTSEIESYVSMVLGRGKYGRELHSGSLVANHASRPYATTLICPEICPKDIKYWYRVLKFGFGCLLRSGLRCTVCKPRLKAAKKQLRRGLSSPQKVTQRITESLNNIATIECHAIRSATLSEACF